MLPSEIWCLMKLRRATTDSSSSSMTIIVRPNVMMYLVVRTSILTEVLRSFLYNSNFLYRLTLLK